MQPTSTPTAWTVSEAAAHLNCSQASVRRLIADGDLRAYRLKKEFRIPDAEMRRFTAVGLVQAQVQRQARAVR